MDDSEIPVVLVWEEGKCSNNNYHGDERHPSRSFNIPSYTPISQPPRPITPLLNPTEFAVANPLKFLFLISNLSARLNRF